MTFVFASRPQWFACWLRWYPAALPRFPFSIHHVAVVAMFKDFSVPS